MSLLSRRAFLGVGTSAVLGCASSRSTAPPRAVDGRPVGVAAAFVRRGEEDVFETRGALVRDTALQVASLSKPVFAYALAMEAARGAMDLDAPLARIASPPYAHRRRQGTDAFDDGRLARVTPRLLLSHRAGLPNWSRDRPLAFVEEPGARWIYSGEGYGLLQEALRAAGQPLEPFARRLVFEPLGMTRSRFDPKAGDGPWPGHARSGEVVPSSLGEAHAATSLVSTVSDYARFVRRILDAPEEDPVVRSLLAPQVDVDAERGIRWGTGFGLASPEWFFHWGANPGFRSLFVGSRRRGEAVVVLTDSDAGMDVAADLVRRRFGDLPLLGFPMLYPAD